MRMTDGFDTQAALLAPRENGPNRGAPKADGSVVQRRGSNDSNASEPEPFVRTGRGKHEWRMALLGARNDMITSAVAMVNERAERDANALTAFEHTMKFAEHESVSDLAIDGALNIVTGALPSPMNSIKATVTLVGDIYGKARAASRNVRLDAWIEAHRDALVKMRERRIGEHHAELAWLGEQIEVLLSDDSDNGERQKQSWETSMTTIRFPVSVTSAQLEFHLYDQWCRQAGAYFSVNVYRTDRHYPGQEEIGTTDQNHRAFAGRQVFGMKVPEKILDRLERVGIDPLRALDLPIETRHHEREPGTGRWKGGQTSRSDLQKGQP